MERLTQRTKTLESVGVKYSQKDEDTYFEILNKLGEYEDLEEQGLLLRLPTPIGKKVYVVIGCLAPNCDLCKAFEWHRGCYPEYRGKIIEREMRYGDIPKFGKTVFLTRTEAEEALKKMEEKV